MIAHPDCPSFASSYGEDGIGVWTSIEVAQATQHLRWIPPGEFWMGSSPDEFGREEKEGPRHRVQLTRGYWLADTACTQALWEAVMDNNPSEFKNDLQNPVETVTWDDTQEFLNRLQLLLPNCAAVLPTEAEWEYACRAGTNSPFSFGSTISPTQANFNGEHPYSDTKRGLYRKRTVPVKALPANAWGLYQMHGNVWEWCADDLRKFDGAMQVDPYGPMPDDPDANRVVRGGSWRTIAHRARSASRVTGYRGKRYGFHGFRFALKSLRDTANILSSVGLVVPSVLAFGPKTVVGDRVQVLAPAFTELIKLLDRDPSALFKVNWRSLEEIIAAAYSKAGYDEVTLTPRSADGGRDVIAVKRGYCTVRILDSVKAYGPGRRVSAEEVRSLWGVVCLDNGTKGVLSTTGEFAPGIMKDRTLTDLMPHRLELISGSS